MVKRFGKRAAVCFFIFLLLLFGNGIQKTDSLAAEIPQTDAYAYVVMDANNGEILYQKNMDKKLYPASLTKMMTAVVALESEKAGNGFTCTQEILSSVPGGVSNAGARAGVTYTFDDMMKMLLLPSGADGAYLLAYDTYGGLGKFIGKMNRKAEEIGMKYTEYDNPIGLDISDGYNHLSGTAEDYAVLTRYAMGKKEIRDIVKLGSAKLSDGTFVTNTNGFYSAYKNSVNGYQIIGTKTGSTDDAGLCLAATARDDEGHEVICVYFKGRSRDGLYGGVKGLFDYTFSEAQEGNITLSIGAYDVRFRDSEDLVRDYLERGIMKMTKRGEFYPDRVCTRKQMAAVCTKVVKEITDERFKAVKPKKTATLCDYAKMVSGCAVQMLGDKPVNVLKKQKSERALTGEEVNALTSVYSAGIIPQRFGYDYDKELTREDLVSLSSSLSLYLSSLAD